MRPGFSVKEAADVLRISPSKVTQAVDPAFEKVARLMLADPEKTLAELQAAIDRLRRPPRPRG